MQLLKEFVSDPVIFFSFTGLAVLVFAFSMSLLSLKLTAKIDRKRAGLRKQFMSDELLTGQWRPNCCSTVVVRCACMKCGNLKRWTKSASNGCG